MSAEPLSAEPLSAHDVPVARPTFSEVAADPRKANIVYHDWEASTYDEKWSISFDDRCIDYAVGRFSAALGGTPRRFEKVLEVGGGTGFFLLNVAQAGWIGEAWTTDISEEMVKVCVANGHRLGIEVTGRTAEAESLPFADDSFDLVMGHAFIHHVPDLEVAFSEFMRVLKPGGTLIIAGEPTLLGDFIANQWKRATRIAVKTAAAFVGRERILAPDHWAPEDAEAAGLEWHVDLHIFTPAELERLAKGGGFTEVRTVTEELTANWFGWVTRTAEAMLRPELIPDRYPLVAYRIWKTLFSLDSTVLRHVVPKNVFYNAVLHARKPVEPTR